MYDHFYGDDGVDVFDDDDDDDGCRFLNDDDDDDNVYKLN
jgi:hypothetical protein